MELIAVVVYVALGVVTAGFILATAPKMRPDGIAWLAAIWPVFVLVMVGYEIGKAIYGKPKD